MAFFSKSPSHKKYVDTTISLTGQLFDKTTGSDSKVQTLNFQRRDSLFRYLMFCLSTTHLFCAPKMKNPDAVLNEVLQTLLSIALSDNTKYFGEEIDPQIAANLSAEILNDYLHRWSTYLEILSGGNQTAALNIIFGVLGEIESENPVKSEDFERIVNLVVWILSQEQEINSAFSTLLKR